MPKKPTNKKAESDAVEFKPITKEEFSIDIDIDDWDLSVESNAISELEFTSDSNELDSTVDADLRGFISPEFGAAKCERPDTEAVCTKVKIIKDALIEILNGIQARQEFCVGQPINCQDGKECRNRFTNSSKFYLPDFVMQLLQEYGFKKEIRKLNISGPRHRINGINYIFEKDIHGMYGTCSITYACTLKQSLRNFFVMVNDNNPLHWAGLHYVQYLHNTCQGRGNWSDFTNNAAIRSVDYSFIPSKHYTNAGKAIFSLFSIWSFRKDEKKGGRKNEYWE